jgi:hypothetical protein
MPTNVLPFDSSEANTRELGLLELSDDLNNFPKTGGLPVAI